MTPHPSTYPESKRTPFSTATPLRTLTGLTLTAILVGAFMPSAYGTPLTTGPEDSDDTAQDPRHQMEHSEMILVMDASGSMNADDAGDQTRIAAAKDSLNSVVDSLEDHQHVGLRVFAGEVTDSEAPEACEDSRLVVDIDTDNRDELRSAIDDYDAVGARTPLAHALEEAADDLGDEGNRTIVLVSDGEENCVEDPCEAAQAIADQGIDVAIHTVGFQIEDEESEAAREQLQCIAEAGGGDYFDATDAETLTHTLERITYRAQMPFSLFGEEVEPGSNQDNAPVLEPGAQYIGSFEYETMYYRVPRNMQDSTLHVGIATYNDSADNWENAEIELTTMGDNRTCGRDRVNRWGTTGANLFRTAQISAAPEYDGESRDAGCWENDELLLAIHSGGRFGEGDEILGQPFELIIEEEPDPTNGEAYYLDYQDQGLPWEADDLQWQDMPRDRDNDEEIIAGNSLNNAAELEPGETYDTDILPGEVQVYRVAADWHQQIQAEAFFPEPDSAPSENIQSNSTQIHLDILSPYRGSATPSRNSSGSDIADARSRLDRTDATTLHRFTHPVWWPNRYSTSGGNSEHPATVAGDYYVVVSAEPIDDNVSYSMPYRLTADTFDFIDAEVPDYSAEASSTGEADSTEAAPEPEPAETDEEAVPQDTESASEPPAEPTDSEPEDASSDENEEALATEQTGFLSGATGLLLGLSALAVLLLAVGGFILARVLSSSNSEDTTRQ
ncbi:VWA domain-containing protein [Nesterenkonia salmonea]|uniref:VWA domain-containing protein n=1 Tax=Nesterenkonia salmonea TaxID=1804987 RepID=A0A5R9BBU9_9MICC|nr:VWA domain-containing protein [Nesterenkonia salmonea]TLP98105.1 VWA domain-containing protein [Nesterenkonia salmonea]